MVRLHTTIKMLLAMTLATIPIAASAALSPSLAKAAASSLRPGQYLWDDSKSGVGPVAIMVSIDRQHLYVYRDAMLIGVSTVSTGKPGKRTPMGEYRILQKTIFHRSNLYSNAPMPYMQRLTWGGIALHGGHLPGYPASHGCIRLPLEFAKKLFAATDMGGIVSVSDGQSGPFLRIEVDVAALSTDSKPIWNAKASPVRMARADIPKPATQPRPVPAPAPKLALDQRALAQNDPIEPKIPASDRDPAKPHWLVPYYADVAAGRALQ